MLSWFNRLDTARRIFVLCVIAFYAWFILIYGSSITYFFKLLIFNQAAFKLQMEFASQSSELSSLGLAVGEAPMSPALTGFKLLGISLLVVGALSYALFRKRAD